MTTIYSWPPPFFEPLPSLLELSPPPLESLQSPLLESTSSSFLTPSNSPRQPKATSIYSPKDWFPVIKQQGRKGKPTIKADIPKNKTYQKVIYQWVNIKTGERYVGKTDNLNPRLNSYSYLFSTPTSSKLINNKQRLYPDMTHSHEDFLLGVTKVENEDSPRKIEKEAIRHYKERGQKLYNLIEGGGGPKSRKVLVF
jgi:GIY-YIG catalytic domain